MEENGGPAASDSSPCPARLSPRRAPRRARAALTLAALALASSLSGCHSGPRTDGLTHVRTTGLLVYGSDKEGGGPYIYPDPEQPRQVTGFEVEILREVAGGLGARPQFQQGQWDRLLQNLDAGQVDLVVNGYEWTETRARNYLCTRPYYVYQLQFLAPRGGPLGAWDDLGRGTPRRGGKWKVGVLTASAADTYAAEKGGATVEVVRFDGATDAMTAVANGQIDATLQDLPAALFYRDRFPTLNFAGPPVGRGYYVMYARRDDRALCDAIDRVIADLVASGRLKQVYERYGIWNDAQAELATLRPEDFRASTRPAEGAFDLLRRYAPLLLDAATVTVILSCSSMPLAMAIGLAVALGRLYGPAPLKWVLTCYVELLRGTPLMLQLYVLFYLLKLPPWVAGIAGLAINYSAYEAEIYRAGLQAIPAGQMEAALALGMSRWMALRRVVVPQAVRVVIPPVTNDFIALFKDTSVCSVITLVELTKQYSILANSTGGVLPFAVATAVLYMAMSLPLSWFSRWSERRLGAGGKGGVLA